MARQGKHFKVVQPADSSDIFHSKPHEIYALRKAYNWSSMDLGGILGLSSEEDGYRCRSVANWERGRNRPMRVFRAKMVVLADRVRDDYLRIVRSLTEGPKANLYIPVVVTSARQGMRNKLKFITPEQQERINAKSRHRSHSEAPD